MENKTRDEQIPWEFTLIPILLAALFVISCPLGKITWLRFTIGGLAIVMASLFYSFNRREIGKEITKIGFWIIWVAWMFLAFLSISMGLGFFPNLK